MAKTAKIFDLNNYLYRVFHTSSPTYNSNGLRNDVIKRIYKEMSDIRNSLGPSDDIFIVSDAEGPTFRHLLTPTYKSNKKGMPEELKCQENPLLDLFRAGGFKVIAKSGYEADDSMGMIANELISRDFDFIEIHSNDKDLLQLVNDKINVFNPSSKVMFDHDAVVSKFGIVPKLIPDMLALIGDKSDGIIGIDGVGEKSAVNWINQHGSASNVFAHRGEIKGRGAKALQESYMDIDLNLKLTNIVSDPSLLTDEELGVISHSSEADNFDDLLKEYEVYSSSSFSNYSAPSFSVSEEKKEESKPDTQLSFF